MVYHHESNGQKKFPHSLSMIREHAINVHFLSFNCKKNIFKYLVYVGKIGDVVMDNNNVLNG